MVNHAVVAVVNYEGKLLVGKKRKDSLKFLAGEWHIPGETVENSESDEEALKRGMREEAGLDIRVGRYLGKHITPTSQKEALWYECFADTSQVTCGSDLEDIKWIPCNEVLSHFSSRVTDLWSAEIKNYFR